MPSIPRIVFARLGQRLLGRVTPGLPRDPHEIDRLDDRHG